MQLKKVLLSLTLAFLVVANCVAQDEAKKQDNPKAKKATERAVANTTKQMVKQFAAAELTDEQQAKVKAIVKKHAASIIEARKAQDSMLSSEQKAQRTEAVAKAKEEGVKGNKVFAVGVKAMGLSEEELKEFNDAKKKVTEITGKIKAEITALLTDEQKAAMPAKKKRGEGKGKKKKKDGDDAKSGGKTQTVALKLPGMT